MINFVVPVIVTILMTLLFVLTIPSYITVSYDGCFRVKIKFLYIPISIFPVSFNIKKLKNRKACLHNKGKSKEKAGRTKNKHISLKSLCRILPLLWDFSGKILRHIRINSIYLDAGITGADAENTAMRYAQLYILIGNILPIMEKTCHIKKYNISIYPDFLQLDNPIEFRISIRLSLIFIIYELLRMSLAYVKIQGQENL